MWYNGRKSIFGDTYEKRIRCCPNTAKYTTPYKTENPFCFDGFDDRFESYRVGVLGGRDSCLGLDCGRRFCDFDPFAAFGYEKTAMDILEHGFMDFGFGDRSRAVRQFFGKNSVLVDAFCGACRFGNRGLRAFRKDLEK